MVICGGVRTPFMRAFGKLTGVPADDLAHAVFTEVLASTGVDASRLDEVILGCAGPPAEAMNIARVAALRSGVPEHVPAFTVHRNCASGVEAIGSSWTRVRAGEARRILAGGAESMSEAPLKLTPAATRKLVPIMNARSLGARIGLATRLSAKDLVPRPTLRGALTDPISGLIMGDTAEVLARELDISREEQDAYAAESQRRAAAARRDGVFREETMTFFVPPRYKRFVDEDDGIREDATPEKLARLRPVFDRRFGTVTVGNACQLTDGAAALLLAEESAALEDGLPILAVVRDVVNVGCDPRRMGLGPAIAIPRILARNDLGVDDVDRFEINEAFAVQVLACLKQMGEQAPDHARLNVHGGAIALGHPVGATGVRIVLTLAKELRRRGLRLGIASLCVGGGQGSAVLIENPEAS